jgi:ketosteroid isomerase-like protein
MRLFRMVPSSVLAVALMGAACAQPAPPPPAKPDLAAEEQALRAQDAAWLAAVKARDAAGEAALLAPDGFVIRQNEPAMDAAAYQAFEEKFFADNPKVVDGWTTDTVQINESGDWAVQTGTYTISAMGPKADGADTGRFVTRWKKVNGTWKVAQDTSVSTTPLPAKK